MVHRRALHARISSGMCTWRCPNSLSWSLRASAQRATVLQGRLLAGCQTTRRPCAPPWAPTRRTLWSIGRQPPHRGAQDHALQTAEHFLLARPLDLAVTWTAFSRPRCGHNLPAQRAEVVQQAAGRACRIRGTDQRSARAGWQCLVCRMFAWAGATRLGQRQQPGLMRAVMEPLRNPSRTLSGRRLRGSICSHHSAGQVWRETVLLQFLLRTSPVVAYVRASPHAAKAHAAAEVSTTVSAAAAPARSAPHAGRHSPKSMEPQRLHGGHRLQWTWGSAPLPQMRLFGVCRRPRRRPHP